MDGRTSQESALAEEVECFVCKKPVSISNAHRMTKGEHKDKYVYMGSCASSYLELRDDEVIPSTPVEPITAAAQAYAVA